MSIKSVEVIHSPESPEVNGTRLWVLETVRSLSDFEASLTVKVVSTTERTTFMVEVNSADFGKVIGRKGGNARAIRKLLNARARKENRFYDLTILEMPDQSNATRIYVEAAELLRNALEDKGLL